VTELCGEPHPDQPHVVCDKPTPCWSRHASAAHRLNWPGRRLPPQKTGGLDVVEVALRSGERRDR
jgi:hypothetical protein